MLFTEMQNDGQAPNSSSFVSMLEACSNCASLDEGKKLHMCIFYAGLELDVLVGSALVNMYGKCGSLDDAWMTFDNMPEQNVVAWSAMIGVYAKHGQPRRALQLFCLMQQNKVRPDNVTYINLLTACSHAGLVYEACLCFDSMTQDHGMPPTMDHYACMIDLLGRVGLLDEAEFLVNDLPFQPEAASFMTLLGACRRDQGDVERGKRMAKLVFECHLEDVIPYVMLSNVYAAASRGGNSWDLTK